MKINDIYKYFACFFSCFFIVFSPTFLLWWHAPILHSVLLMAYYIPLNILILFDAVALEGVQQIFQLYSIFITFVAHILRQPIMAVS